MRRFVIVEEERSTSILRDITTKLVYPSLGQSICLDAQRRCDSYFHARRRPSSRAIPFYMTFLRRQETSRISSREKGSVYRKGGGSRTSSKRFTNGSTISFVRCNPLVGSSGESIAPTWFPGILKGTRNGQAACMIIEEYPPLPIKPRQNPHQDTTHRFLNHLVLPKHRTSKFSSNRHRKLQPFRET